MADVLLGFHSKPAGHRIQGHRSLHDHWLLTKDSARFMMAATHFRLSLYASPLSETILPPLIARHLHPSLALYTLILVIDIQRAA
jgi:hypothetical protein